MNIFVGKLGSQISEEQLGNLFAPFGDVSSVKIIMDNYTRQSKGFGFVDMPESASAEEAIQKLNNSSFLGQLIVVNEARPRNNSDRSHSRNR